MGGNVGPTILELTHLGSRELVTIVLQLTGSDGRLGAKIQVVLSL